MEIMDAVSPINLFNPQLETPQTIGREFSHPLTPIQSPASWHHFLFAPGAKRFLHITFQSRTGLLGPVFVIRGKCLSENSSGKRKAGRSEDIVQVGLGKGYVNSSKGSSSGRMEENKKGLNRGAVKKKQQPGGINYSPFKCIS